MEKTIPSRVRGTGLQLKIGQSGQATFRWSDMSKGVKEVSRLGQVSEEEFQVQGTVLAKALGGNVLKDSVAVDQCR